MAGKLFALTANLPAASVDWLKGPQMQKYLQIQEIASGSSYKLDNKRNGFPLDRVL
jgi:hypothetical protein